MLRTYKKSLSKEVIEELNWHKRTLRARIKLTVKRMWESSVGVPQYKNVLSVTPVHSDTNSDSTSTPNTVTVASTEGLQSSAQAIIPVVKPEMRKISKSEANKPPSKSNAKVGQRKLKI